MYKLLLILFLFSLSLEVCSQTYIFKSEGICEAIKEMDEEADTLKPSIWSEWVEDRSIIMFNLDSNELTILSDSAIVYQVSRDDEGTDTITMAMYGVNKNKFCYIRIIKQLFERYHLYIDDTKKSTCFQMFLKEKVTNDEN